MSLFTIFSKSPRQAFNKRGGSRAKEWTPEERQYLIENYHTTSERELTRVLGRSAPAIRRKANSLGLGVKRYWNAWTPEEDDYLRRNYSKMPSTEIAKHLRRTYGAVISRARKLDIYYRPSGAPEEDAILRGEYPALGARGVLKKLKGRTLEAIKRRASILGITQGIRVRWTEEEKRILEENIGKVSFETLAEMLPGRSMDSIKGQAYYRGLIGGNK